MKEYFSLRITRNEYITVDLDRLDIPIDISIQNVRKFGARI